MNIGMKIPSAILVLLVSAVAAFVATIALVNSADGNVNGPLRVDTVQEAEEAVDYQVSLPSYRPDGFERGPIIVSTNPINTSLKSVVQYWNSSGDAGFLLIQEPGLDGLGNEGSPITPITVNGISGERVLHSAGDPPSRKYDQVTLYWREGDMGFAVIGWLSDPLSEDVLIRIAESVGSN